MKNLAAKVIKNRVLVLLAIAIVIMGAVLVMPAKEIQTPFFGKTITVGFAGQASAAVVLDYTVDGTADQVQINQATAALNALGGGMVQLLAGNYNDTAPIVLYENVSLVGMGDGATTICGNSSFSGAGIIQAIGSTGAGTLYNIGIANLEIVGGTNGIWGARPSTDGIHLVWCDMLTINNVHINNIGGAGIYLLNCYFPYVSHIVTQYCGVTDTKPSIWLASDAQGSTNEGSMYSLVMLDNYVGTIGAFRLDGSNGAEPVNTMWVYGVQIENPGHGGDANLQGHDIVLKGDRNGLSGVTISSPEFGYVGILNTGQGNIISNGQFMGPADAMIQTSREDLTISNVIGSWSDDIVSGIILDSGADNCSISNVQIDGPTDDGFTGYGILINSSYNQVSNVHIANTGNDTIEINGNYNFVTNAIVDEATDDNGSNNTVTEKIIP